MNPALVVASGVVAISTTASGILLIRAGSRASGGALLGMAAALVGAGALWTSTPGAGTALLLLSWAVCLPAALLACPRPEWRHPVGFVLWVTTMTAGALVTLGGGREETVLPGSIVIGVALVANHLWRYERADEADRVAQLWMSLAVVVAALVYGASVFLLAQTPARVCGLLAFALVPPALVIGILRPYVLDVRAVIVEVTVFGVAVLAYVAVFVGVASTAELAGVETLSTGTLALIAAVAAVGFHPLRVGLRGVVDELLFGNRPDPLEAATSVADRIGDDPVLALAAVREAMVLPYAALVVGGEELASSGTPVPHTRRLSLALGEDEVGEVVVGLRAGDLRLSSGDERVLRIVAPLLAQTLRARSLAAELRASRSDAIASLEEERRRIRRDLHDGLGPTLSGIAFTADAARNSLPDADAVDALLQTLRREASAAIAETRRLVYGMRPPALDELGLVGALRQWAVQVRSADGTPLAVRVHTPEDLGELPAGVEVAAYRIAVEALTNAARHSGADRAELHVRLTGSTLAVEVRDGGTDPRAWRPGVGLRAMEERASAIGGTVRAEPSVSGGHVVALLPIV